MSKEIHHALSSEARVEILKLIYKKPRGIEEISGSLKLQPVTIRHHIQALLEAGLLEFHEERSGSAGRPKTFYTIAKELPLVVFPPRRYFELSKALVDSLRRKLGEKKTQEILADVGREMGRETIKTLQAQHNISRWTAKDFAEIVVKYLEEAGAEPEIVELSDNKLTYRLHNCLFSEMSQEIPGLLCDIMHHEFQQSMLNSMHDEIVGVQTSCMGHGDINCEHVIEWSPKKELAKQKT